mgnify:CR=1 FL=1
MRNFKQLELYYDEPGEGKGSGEGNGTGNEPTFDDLKAKIENFKKAQAEKDKEEADKILAFANKGGIK